MKNTICRHSSFSDYALSYYFITHEGYILRSSLIINPLGEIIAEMNDVDEGVILAQLNGNALSDIRSKFPIANHIKLNGV